MDQLLKVGDDVENVESLLLSMYAEAFRHPTIIWGLYYFHIHIFSYENFSTKNLIIYFAV